MPVDFEFLSPTDKPALVAVSDMETLSNSQTVLGELGYKVHTCSSFEDFVNRFGGVQYHVVVIDENFQAPTLAENKTLRHLQTLPMAQRRHCVIILVGHSFQTLHAMEAFQQSVHAVINPGELLTLSQIVQKTIADNDLFLRTFRDTQQRIAQG